MAVGREVVQFQSHWELCWGIPPAAQCGKDVEWLLLLAVEYMDMLNMVATEDTYLHVGE